MPAREHPGDRGRRAARRAVADLAADLRSTRIARGLTQQVVADAAGISRSYVGRLERNEVATPGLGHLASLAAALGLRLKIAAIRTASRFEIASSFGLIDAFRSRLHRSVAGAPRSRCRSPATGAPGMRSRSPTTAGPRSRRSAGSARSTRRSVPRTRSSATIRASHGSSCWSRTRRATGPPSDSPTPRCGPTSRSTRGRSSARSRSAGVRRSRGVVLLRIPSDQRGRRDDVRPQVVHNGGKRVDAAEPVRARLVENPVGRAAPGP